MKIKNKTILILSLGLLLLFNACSPRISTKIVQPFTPLDAQAEVLVLSPGQKIQSEVTDVGAVRVWDGGFALNCGYDRVIGMAMDEARKHGGNVLQLTDHKRPDFISSCHRIEARIFKISQPTDEDNSNPGVMIVAEPPPPPQYYPQLVFSLHSGWGRQTAKIGDNIPSDLKPYARRLQNGFQSSGSVSWFFNVNYGAGAKFHYFSTRNEMPGIYITNPEGVTQYGLLRDDISIVYFGPSFATRGIYNKHIISASLSIGYLGYENNFVVVRPYVMKGSDVGFLWDMGYDYSITKNISLGINMAMLSGLLSKYTLDNGSSTQTITLEKDEMIGVGRFDLSAGIRFHF